MKRILLTLTLSLLLLFCYAYAQDDVTIVAANSEAAEGLDLHAVAELFKDCENLEEFERSLNDPDLGINNLDLDNNGYVDFIRVVEDVNDYAHLIILQAALGDDEFQDVATIEVERGDGDEYRMHIRGNEVIYGPDYYFVPSYVHFHTWPIIVWMYRPVYRPYRSFFYYNHYPYWYRPYRPVHVHVYRTRTIKYTRNPIFVARKTPALTVTKRVAYKPRNSVLVKKETAVIHKTGSGTTVRKVTRSSDGSRMEATKTRELRKPTKARDNAVHKRSSSSSSSKSLKKPGSDSKSTVKKSSKAKDSSVKKSKSTKGKSVKKTQTKSESGNLQATRKKTTVRKR
ncbi:hypothetical protein JXO59_01735 [candidate division KSB1 bacterium]|nr:hypothetical protein [candidate division KSB1 bacterium]